MFLLLFPFLYHFITHFDLNASLLLFVSVVHWKGEHHVSLVSLACPFLLVATLSTPSSNIRQSLKIIMVSFPFGFFLTFAVSRVWVFRNLNGRTFSIFDLLLCPIMWIFETLKCDITHLKVTKLYVIKCTFHFHSGMTLLYKKKQMGKYWFYTDRS